MNIRYYIKKIDFVIILIMTILIMIGLYCEQKAFLLSDESHSIFMKHVAGISLGYILIIGIVIIGYHFICSLSFLWYFIMIFLLALTLIVGRNLNNVNRWLIIFGIQFQPSELTKVVLILFLAFLLNYFKNKLNKLYVLIILGAVVAMPTALIALEPHLSSTIAILFISIIVIYSSGISYKVIGTALAIVMPVIAVIIIGVAYFDLDIPFIKSYHIKRILTFSSQDEDNSLSGDYQQLQSIGAISSGGLHGKLAESNHEDRRYRLIYAKESDFVFTIVGEEFGFIGSATIVILYLILIIRCLAISYRTTDYIGKLICNGISAYFMFQIFVNIGVATRLLPNTGLTLPFISYGLTSLVSSMIAVGLILSVGIGKRPSVKQ